MSTQQNVVHSRILADGQAGELLRFSREDVQWEWMSMSARRLNPGEKFFGTSDGEEATFVILGGTGTAGWGAGDRSIGERNSVFDALPSCLSLPSGNAVTFKADG